MNSAGDSLTEDDRKFLHTRGLSPEEVQRQWSLLTRGFQRVDLDRPCRIDDGVEQLAESDRMELVATHRAAADQGRWTKFVPASGAASRMFSLPSSEDKERFCQSIDQFAFSSKLRRQFAQLGIELDTLIRERRYDEIVQRIVSSSGLGYGQLPKGLLDFHSYRGQARTSFEEHLLEAIACLGARNRVIQSHFTVAAESRDQFAGQLQEFVAAHQGYSCDVTFSVQHPSTDTIAVSDTGDLLRSEDGMLTLRPGGHGALIGNLNAVQGDLIFVKNIDNVAHEESRDASITWIQILGGYLVRLQDAIFQHIRSLGSGDDTAVTAAFDFVQITFPNAVLPPMDDPHRMREALVSLLDRPLRVCGMVRNEGEPGGGPFWARQQDGSLSLQIVESAEIDADDENQRTVFEQSTHFNPVFMALAVRDERGTPFDLARFVNQERVIVTEKPISGRDVTVLERPGLWNGAMANWNSVFVEVPNDVFSPVKSVFDLLRQDHQAATKRETLRVP